MAGTHTLTAHYQLGRIRRIETAWVADAADATVPTLVLPKFEGFLLALETNPGATAPTDNYDITLVDGQGLDALQGVGANRDTANTEKVPIVYSGTALHPPVDGDEGLTLTIANNAVNSALGTIVIYYLA